MGRGGRRLFAIFVANKRRLEARGARRGGDRRSQVAGLETRGARREQRGHEARGTRRRAITTKAKLWVSKGSGN